MSLLQIWILQETGTCLFHQKYDNSCSDENLVSGFLSAVNLFVGSFGVELKWIETDKFRFVFNRHEQLIFVACTTTSDIAQETHKKLTRVAEHFFLAFNRDIILDNDPITVDIFKKFSPTINRVFGFNEELLADNAIRKPVFNASGLKFDSAEARLMSFIRYKQRVSVNDIVRFLKLSNEETQNTINNLENRKYIQRIEESDGSEQIGIHPYVRGIF